MSTDKQYLFTSARLGFRNWLDADVPLMAAMNEDAAVMEFFPKLLTQGETLGFVIMQQQSFAAKGYCYFAVDRLDTNAFIGFIGLYEKTFEANFTPCVDIGWRLAVPHWGQGFATEGARRCLEFAFDTLALDQVLSMAPVVNKKSEAVMTKIGMQQLENFKHPLLKGNARLEDCVLYNMTMDAFRGGNKTLC
jgi:RimJ/RimL family protein N-acetyltransferase